jgi:hypothetical protein
VRAPSRRAEFGAPDANRILANDPLAVVETKTISDAARQSSNLSLVQQKIDAPNDAEKAWIAENLGVANALVAQYSTNDATDPIGLNEALTGWSERDGGKAIEPNTVANALGLAFGQHLIDTFGMRWVVVTDEHGTDIAVHGAPGDVLVFPTSLVGKRMAGGEVRFFVDLYTKMAADIQRIRGQVH